jgi:hypothetical protein
MFSCARSAGIAERVGKPDSLVYVTFGGADLCDVIDLVAVFDVRHHRLVIGALLCRAHLSLATGLMSML